MGQLLVEEVIHPSVSYLYILFAYLFCLSDMTICSFSLLMLSSTTHQGVLFFHVYLLVLFILSDMTNRPLYIHHVYLLFLFILSNMTNRSLSSSWSSILYQVNCITIVNTGVELISNCDLVKPTCLIIILIIWIH